MNEVQAVYFVLGEPTENYDSLPPIIEFIQDEIGASIVLDGWIESRTLVLLVNKNFTMSNMQALRRIVRQYHAIRYPKEA